MRYYTPEEVNAEKERLTAQAMQQGQALRAAPQGPSGVSATVLPPMGPKPAEQISALPPVATTNVQATARPPIVPQSITGAGSSYTTAVPTPTAFGDFTAPDPLNFTADPSYQWRQGEQQRALERGAAGRGILLNGRMQARLMAESGNLASQEYGNAFNRALTTYGTNRDTNAQNFGQSMDAWRGGLDAFNANTAAAQGWARLNGPSAGGSASSAMSTPTSAPNAFYGPSMPDFASTVEQARNANLVYQRPTRRRYLNGLPQGDMIYPDAFAYRRIG